MDLHQITHRMAKKSHLPVIAVEYRISKFCPEATIAPIHSSDPEVQQLPRRGPPMAARLHSQLAVMEATWKFMLQIGMERICGA